MERQDMISHWQFGKFATMKESQIPQPSCLAIDDKNDVVVVESRCKRLHIFDMHGNFQFKFGRFGDKDGQLLHPNKVTVMKSTGDIIVTEDSPVHRIQVYNQFGQLLRKFVPDTLSLPRGLTVDNEGRMIVVEQTLRVTIFNHYGIMQKFLNFSKYLEEPNGIVVNDKEEMFISDKGTPCVKVFNYDGEFLRSIGGDVIKKCLVGLRITRKGELVIVDSKENFNLTFFTQDGTLVSAYESKLKHPQCIDFVILDDRSVVFIVADDGIIYVYRYLQSPPDIEDSSVDTESSQ